MTDKLEPVKLITEEELETFASQEHDKWAHWMRYLFSKSQMTVDGRAIIPTESVQHWIRQCETPYAVLSDEEKESDRKVVREFFYDVIEKMSLRNYFDQMKLSADILDSGLGLWQRIVLKLSGLDYWRKRVQSEKEHVAEMLEIQNNHARALKGSLGRAHKIYDQSRDTANATIEGYKNQIRGLETKVSILCAEREQRTGDRRENSADGT